MASEEPTAEAWLAALAASHRRLVSVVERLPPGAVAGPSYASEWTIAEVLGHLGSGAEIFSLFLRAGVAGDPPPGPDAFQPIWDRWNTKSPEDQATDALVADRAFLDEVEQLDDHQRQVWRLSLFGTDQTLGDLLRLRLGEHAVHTWDIEVMGDAQAVVAQDAVDLLVDRLDQWVARAHHDAEVPVRVTISTTGPNRRLVLVADHDGTRLVGAADGSVDPDTALGLPGEAWLRLVYGRLDPQHTPTVVGDATTLDTLRRLFPGF